VCSRAVRPSPVLRFVVVMVALQRAVSPRLLSLLDDVPSARSVQIRGEADRRRRGSSRRLLHTFRSNCVSYVRLQLPARRAVPAFGFYWGSATNVNSTPSGDSPCSGGSLQDEHTYQGGPTEAKCRAHTRSNAETGETGLRYSSRGICTPRDRPAWVRRRTRLSEVWRRRCLAGGRSRARSSKSGEAAPSPGIHEAT